MLAAGKILAGNARLERTGVRALRWQHPGWESEHHHACYSARRAMEMSDGHDHTFLDYYRRPLA